MTGNDCIRFSNAFSGQVAVCSHGMRSGLRNEIIVSSGLAVVIRPAVNGWNCSGPVAMQALNRCSPFNRIALPRILNGFLSAENTVEEVGNENQLSKASDESERADDIVDV